MSTPFPAAAGDPQDLGGSTRPASSAATAKSDTTPSAPRAKAAGVTLPQVLSRIGAAVLGGYVFCWGLYALGLAGFYRLGMSFHDAEHLSGMVAVLSYLVAFLWAFGAAKVWKVWALLLVGGAVMTGAGTLIQRSML